MRIVLGNLGCEDVSFCCRCGLVGNPMCKGHSKRLKGFVCPSAVNSPSMSAVASSATVDVFLMSSSIVVMSAVPSKDGSPVFSDVNSAASRCVEPFADVNSLLRCLLCNRQGCDASHC